MKKSVIYIQTYSSPAGNLILGSYGNNLVLCDWECSPHRERNLKRLARALKAEVEQGSSHVLRSAKAQLKEYFSGKRQDFNIPLLFDGTGFQKKVWDALQEIPYGQTISYLALSERLQCVPAIRAVARAVGANPLSVFAPCHRVIGSDKGMVGYAGGIPAKQYLLELEGVLPPTLFGPAAHNVPAKSARTALLAGPAPKAQAAGSAKPEKPAAPARPSKEKPAAPDNKPAASAKPAHPARGAQPNKPAKGNKSTKGTKKSKTKRK